MADQPDRLNLELSRVSYFASGSVSALVTVHLAAEQTGTELALTNVPPNLHRVLELSGVRSLFRIQPVPDAGH